MSQPPVDPSIHIYELANPRIPTLSHIISSPDTMADMRLEPFLMERMQSTWENRVEFNLSESGVHPMTLQELLDEEPDSPERILKQELGYSQSNGTIPLRETIAFQYPKSTTDHILVTNGTSEANFLCTWNLADENEEIALMLPNYMQIWGIARGFRGKVRPLYLREEREWHPDLAEWKQQIGPATKLICLCNPNNPTGSILTEVEMQAIVDMAEKAGAWLLVDEVYRGAERDMDRTPSFWGRYSRTIITSGLSKAYGLPGLRIGWVVASPELISKLWSYHDYTTIGPGTLSDMLARIALSPGVQDRILSRTRSILKDNYPILRDWIHEHGNMFAMVEPHAGAIAYLRYNLEINSTQLAEKLLHEKSTLIVPGDHFGMDRYLRIGYGPPEKYLRAALDRVHSTLMELAGSESVRL